MPSGQRLHFVNVDLVVPIFLDNCISGRIMTILLNVDAC